MKKILIKCIIVVCVGIGFWLLFTHSSSDIDISKPATHTSPKVSAIPDIEIPTVTYNNIQYAYAVTEKHPEDIFLIPNFTEKQTSDQLRTLFSCDALVNGGFYHTTDTPIGLFISDLYTKDDVNPNKLTDAFFSKSLQHDYSISFTVPDTDVLFTLQNGPMLIANNLPIPLTITEDEYARRSVVYIDTDNKPGFLVIYTPDNVYNGPKLADIPFILREIATKKQINISYAMNLDGGTASAFITENTQLKELSPVGSIFCVVY